ncbi:MAG: aldehyde dehydrogenase family protein, partial [Anaerolineae bacterium]|nr:aldehyde dehydrogenase family protein [Anaerolineae bacterium]
SSERAPVKSPYSGETIDMVPVATPGQIEQALAAAEAGAVAMARLTAYDRNQILNRAAELIEANVDDLAQTISQESGKPLSEAQGEASRMPDLLRLCAFEGTQLRGETLPVDAHAGAQGKMGFTIRVPCGIVVAISPYNYPLLLVLHKVGPALAAGNAVILKPATQTPLVALKLTQLLLEAGLPENGLQCLTGSGAEIGPALCADDRVRKISFTGSTAVGEQITKVAGVKKLSLELGSNCPMVIMPDADLNTVAKATAVAGYVNAGQVCISLQRVIAHRDIYADFLDAVKDPVEAIKIGDPQAEDTRLGAMISEQEAIRVGEWVDEAVRGGARLITGGERHGAVFAPTVVADVAPQMRISCEELFGPAIAVTPVDNIDEAIALSNDSKYGLGAGIFTRDVNHALRFAREVQTGSVMVNWTPLWRADLMPYGGFKQSGVGKEGPRYAVEEMTEIKTVVFHGVDG